ncbi:hypothetical protein GCM10007047_26430 [Cerasicoccus arenae]|uniref:Uncharacterized protein n=1 Tax=Cerasicoccus arenae TaxID=424488 RepID=A0A8J3DJT1_9BACT|nr:hypothetical protein GCM10007047_26430 [Cerasicoccus arenae]
MGTHNHNTVLLAELKRLLALVITHFADTLFFESRHHLAIVNQRPISVDNTSIPPGVFPSDLNGAFNSPTKPSALRNNDIHKKHYGPKLTLVKYCNPILQESRLHQKSNIIGKEYMPKKSSYLARITQD